MTRVTLCGPLRCGELLLPNCMVIRRRFLCLVFCAAFFSATRCMAAWMAAFFGSSVAAPDFFSRASFFFRRRALRSCSRRSRRSCRPRGGDGRDRISRGRVPGSRSLSWRNGSTAPAGYARDRHRRSSRTRCSRTGGIPGSCRSRVPGRARYICCGSSFAGQTWAHSPQRMQGRSGSGAGGLLAARSRQQAIAGLGHRYLVAVQGETHHRARRAAVRRPCRCSRRTARSRSRPACPGRRGSSPVAARPGR